MDNRQFGMNPYEFTPFFQPAYSRYLGSYQQPARMFPFFLNSGFGQGSSPAPPLHQLPKTMTPYTVEDILHRPHPDTCYGNCSLQSSPVAHVPTSHGLCSPSSCYYHPGIWHSGLAGRFTGIQRAILQTYCNRQISYWTFLTDKGYLNRLCVDILTLTGACIHNLCRNMSYIHTDRIL